MTVSFLTGCYWRDAPRMHSPNYLSRLVSQHDHHFDEVILVHQDYVPDFDLPPFPEVPLITDVPNLKIIRTSEHKNILQDFGIPYPNSQAEIFYDGKGDPHWWVKHLINVMCSLKSATSDYIVWQDSDVSIPFRKNNQKINNPPNWINIGIEQLKNRNEILVVCPGDGTKSNNIGTETKIMSQQIFLANRSRLMGMNWNTPFPYHRHNIPKNWPAPFPQYWWMGEGFICRLMMQYNLWRLVLDSKRWRYWHWNPIELDKMFNYKIDE